MIKTPQIGQTVFFFESGEIKSGKINYLFKIGEGKSGEKTIKFTNAVEIGYCFYRPFSEIYATEESAQKNQKNEISKTLKNLNKQILELSKKREKLASKLAGLI